MGVKSASDIGLSSVPPGPGGERELIRLYLLFQRRRILKRQAEKVKLLDPTVAAVKGRVKKLLDADPPGDPPPQKGDPPSPEGPDKKWKVMRLDY